MAKTASKSFSLSNFSQSHHFLLLWCILYTATSTDSSSSENINSTARFSRLSFRFLWLWWSWSQTFKTLLKYSNKFKFHLSIKRDKPELNINIYSFLIDCFVLIMIVSYCSVLIKYLLVPVKHPSSFNEISLTFWQEFIVTKKHWFYTLRFIFFYFLSLFFLFSIAQ